MRAPPLSLSKFTQDPWVPQDHTLQLLEIHYLHRSPFLWESRHIERNIQAAKPLFRVKRGLPFHSFSTF